MTFRVDDAEKSAIEANAAHEGLTPGSFIRSRALAKPTTRAVRRPSVETAQLAQLLGMLGALGGQIQVLALTHGAGGDTAAAEVQDVLSAFRGAVAAILQTMGKRPTLRKDRGS